MTTIIGQVSLSVGMHFDGWLVNIENQLPASLVPRLVTWLRLFAEESHRCVYQTTATDADPARRNPESEVIWYDAVTTSGELQWQNNVTPSNRVFLDACDGIFLNYKWSDDVLSESLPQLPEALRHRVYVSVVRCIAPLCFLTNSRMCLAVEHGAAGSCSPSGWVQRTHPNASSASRLLRWQSQSTALLRCLPRGGRGRRRVAGAAPTSTRSVRWTMHCG